MRVLIWHGWLLEGSGSNIGAARIAEVLRSAGHDVLVLCQEPHPERYRWIDAWGTVGAGEPSPLVPSTAAAAATGRCVLLRPQIGELLPVFVIDEYEGFAVKTFVDLTQAELDDYLHKNVEALAAAARWHDSDVVITGHAVPGAAVAKRALGARRYVAKIHGSDIEYAIRPQARYRRLAAEGLEAALAVAGPSAEALRRCRALVPSIDGDRTRVISPGVDVASFHPRPRREALLSLAERLDADADVGRGRPSSHDVRVARAVADRDPAALDELARTYDQEVPDPDAGSRLRELAVDSAPIVGYFGKLIPQKGVELMLAGVRAAADDPVPLVVGFGLHREWLTALDLALRSGDAATVTWILDAGRSSVEAGDMAGATQRRSAIFTGRLDHRYAPSAIAAMDILVVPSTLAEAFGMVGVEGAATGALPLLARHSGLAEVAAALEESVGHQGLFSFEPGAGAVGRVASAIDRLLSISPEGRDQLRSDVSAFVARTYSWERTADLLLDAAARR
jgi:glycosyltransferase involved in cell wall biosynthesis